MVSELNARRRLQNGEECSADLAERKRLRRQSIERRLALSLVEHAALSASLRGNLREAFPQLASLRVGFCWPVKQEPDLRPLCEAWYCGAQPGFAALLPVVVAESTALAFRIWRPGTALRDDTFGIPTPIHGEFIEPDALLLPVNAFDRQGYRLGYGGGYFDRTLAGFSRKPLCIGVGFELARVASILPQPHDVPLDAVVTEAGVFRPSSLQGLLAGDLQPPDGFLKRAAGAAEVQSHPAGKPEVTAAG